MKPVYAITSNTEISYGETFSFLWHKIIAVVKSTMLKKVFFRSFNTKLCLFHIIVSFLFFILFFIFFIILRILYQI
jgi:hypothetical protein